MARYKYITLILLLIGQWSWAQDRYVVYFTDKDNSPYSINNPAQYLSQKAIDRRVKQQITISTQDLPVNPEYVTTIRQNGVEVYFKSKWMNAVLVQATAEQIATIEALPFVDRTEFVAPGIKLKSNSKSGRVMENEETEATENEFQNSLLGIPAFHDNDVKGEGISIGFMDSGFQGVNVREAFSHLFTNNQVALVYNFVENDDNVYQYDKHGTEVLSPVSAAIDGAYTGVATEADVMLFVTEDFFSEYRIEEYNFLFASELADSAGVDIITTSLGYSDYFDDDTMDYPHSDMDGNTTIITKAAELAFSKGILVVTSVGNEGRSSTRPYLTAPADGPNVMSVGAVGASGTKADFSSIGPTSDGRTKPDLMAYGINVSVVTSSGSIIGKSGTSFAAPQIAGLAALLWQTQPELTNRELFDLMLSLGSNHDSPNNNIGHGIPNYDGLIANIEDQLSSIINFYPNPFAHSISITGLNSTKKYSIDIIDMTGKVLLSSTAAQSDHLEIATEALQAGIYMLVITSENDSTTTARIVKY